MKNVSLIILSIILIVTACKKDNPKPEPNPSPTAQSQIYDLEGKGIFLNLLSRRIIESNTTVFYGILPVLDSTQVTMTIVF
jgi:hypothetical protein